MTQPPPDGQPPQQPYPTGPYPAPQPPYGAPYPPQYPPAYPPAYPVPYGAPPPGYGQPMYPQQMPYPHIQQVRQTGMAVTTPAWSVGEIMAVVFTCGLALPIIWMSRRKRTTITRHR